MPRANHYRFDRGADGDLVYIDPALTGGRQLIYREKTYTGTDMSAYKSEIGLLATVELETSPDVHTTSLTLLVPPVNVTSEDRTAHVYSWAIISKSRMTKTGPDGVVGQVISYEMLNLAGTASRQIV